MHDIASHVSRRSFLKQSAIVSGVTAVGWKNNFAQAEKGSPSGQAQSEAWQESLAEQTLRSIEVAEVRLRYPRLVGRNARLGMHGHGPHERILILTTNDGVMGWGQAGHLGDPGKHVPQLREQYVGKSIGTLFEVGQGLREGIDWALDIALHDLAGQILELPVYAMMGAKVTNPTATPCYSGMIYFDDFPPEWNLGSTDIGVQKIVANARQDHDLGYRQLKIKIGRGNRWMPHDEGLARDIEVVLALADALPDTQLLVDANDGYSLEDTIAFLDGIGDTELLWFEEPFQENVEGFRALKQHIKETGRQMYVADGERDPDPKLLETLINEGLLDCYLTDVVGMGFTSWRAFMPWLAERNVLASPHAWGTMLKTCYTAHLASGLGNVLTIEGVTCQSDEVDFSAYKLDEHGKIAPPELPGFGLPLLLKV